MTHAELMRLMTTAEYYNWLTFFRIKAKLEREEAERNSA